MILSYNPLRIFMPVGLLLGVIGIVKLVHDLAAYDYHVATDTLLIIFASFQVIAIGLLADLIVRVGRDRNEMTPASVRTGDAA
jgi:hypothetical protein